LLQNAAWKTPLVVVERRQGRAGLSR
jgi:hypothetical protein